MLEHVIAVLAFPTTAAIWAALAVGLTFARRMPAFKGE